MATEQCTVKGLDKRTKAIPIGTQFGLLTVLEYIGAPKGLWKCRCDCGYANCRKEVVVQGAKLRAGHTRTCGHKRPIKGDRFIERIRQKAVVNEHGCWIMPETTKGYARIRIQGRHTRVHRKTWEIMNGPIPDGMEICHDCPGGDNKACCNPEHMFLGTHRDNMEDWVRKKSIVKETLK